jgi:cation:H+ antiporter
VAIGHRLAASMMLWLAFALCATAILVAGTRLSREGDEIARLTGMGGTWVGMALLATVTSLPELMTGLSAVTWPVRPRSQSATCSAVACSTSR